MCNTSLSVGIIGIYTVQHSASIKRILDTLKRHTRIADYHVTNDNPQKLTVVKTR